MSLLRFLAIKLVNWLLMSNNLFLLFLTALLAFCLLKLQAALQ